MSPPNLAKNLEETPNTDAAEYWNGEIVVPAKQVYNFAAGGDESRPDRHDGEGEVTRDARLGLGQAQGVGQDAGESKDVRKHEGIRLVTRERSRLGRQPAPEIPRRSDADEEGGEGSGEGLSAADPRRVATEESTEGAGGGIAPAEEQDAHDADVLGEEVEDDPGAEEVEDDAVPSRVFALPHEGAENHDVYAVERREVESKIVDRSNGY